MFQAPKLTDAGKALYYENLAGCAIKFTTIQLGSGRMADPIAAMTALVQPVVTVPAEAKNNNGQYVDISGHFSNAELRSGFYWREVGVFAADPAYPDDRSRDILYCYQNAYDTADYIPTAAVETVEKVITVPIIVGDAASVSCTLSASQIYVTEEDLNGLERQLTPLPGAVVRVLPMGWMLGDVLHLGTVGDAGSAVRQRQAQRIASYVIGGVETPKTGTYEFMAADTNQDGELDVFDGSYIRSGTFRLADLMGGWQANPDYVQPLNTSKIEWWFSYEVDVPGVTAQSTPGSLGTLRAPPERSSSWQKASRPRTCCATST